MSGYEEKSTRSQRSMFVPWLPSATKKTIAGDTLYSRMLVENATAGVAAIGWPLLASIRPPNARAEQLIAHALARRDHLDLTEALRGFLIDSTQYLLAFSQAAYEIVYSVNSSGKPDRFDLQSIPSWTLRRTRRGWLQSIPPAFPNPSDPPRKIRLPADSVFALHPPAPIRKFLRPMIADLDKLGRNNVPRELVEDFARARDLEFDFKLWHTTHQTALAHATRKSGWSARALLQNEMTDFYSTYRFLRFEAFKIGLRDSLVEQLNDLLSRVGPGLDFSAAISISGAPTRHQAQKAMQSLKDGSASITTITKPFLIGRNF